jgi:hypothetical protein
MKRLFPVFSLLVFFGCKEVSFKNPQPEGKKELTSVPKSLRGKYLVKTDEAELSKDTVIITSNGYRFGYFDPLEREAKNDQYEEGVISDSLVLKSFKGYYFVNLNEDPEWILRILKPEKNGDLIYMTLEEKGTSFNVYLEELSSQIRIDSMTTDKETLYQIDPDPNQLIHLIENGYVSKTTLVKLKK